MWSGKAFSGAKVAIFFGDSLLAYKRDEKPGIPYPGLWDLPGGGREGNESPVECVSREVEEEFGLSFDISRFNHERHYEAGSESPLGNEFFTASITKDEVKKIVFGSEGQFWKLMPTEEFISHPDSVPKLRMYVENYLKGQP